MTESSINNINIEDVKKYHHDFYRPNNSKFFIAGDINDQKQIKCDVVIFSNILEHISKRNVFLENVIKNRNNMR